ncbi:hypothetical protein NFI96_026458 [Prochilodus magdalenae]|nr:hypothetical protein NFI96_026458 [Prochilodus magdalenae]
MEASWLHATLLSLFLLGSALPEKPHECKDSIPLIQQVVVHGNVSVPCPSFNSVEMTFKLYKGNRIMENCTVQRNTSDLKAPRPTNEQISHHVNTKDNSTKFVLSNVTENHTGLYFCEAQNTFPPPVRTYKEKTVIIAVMQEIQQQSTQCNPPENHLPLWVGLGVLTIYGLIITYAAFSLRRPQNRTLYYTSFNNSLFKQKATKKCTTRLTKVDFNKHDYMNMRPKARRKNQGILHPTRLSWYSDNTVNAVSCKHSSKRTPK